MVATAIDFHQRGIIPAATYLVDLDAIAANARLMAEESKRHNLRSYLMSKQNGRNPYITRVALAQGIDSTVAVEATEARVIHRYGLPLGHVGHLSNVPKNEVADIVAMHPEVITVFTYEAAKAVSDAAVAQGRHQNLYVRVNKPGDEFFKGMVGGWTEEDCVEGVRRIIELPNVAVIGLTTFVNITYQTPAATAAKPTDTFFTMLRAKALLERELGLKDLRVNAPAFNNCATFKMLAEHGVTDVEPGIGLLGSSLAHAYEDLAETPAQVYVSEVMHHWEGEAYTLGGGLTYVETSGGPHEYQVEAIIGSTFDEAKDNFLPLVERGIIDYHGVLADGHKAKVGDTAIYALRAQFFVNRCYVAIVSGISTGEPRLERLFDSAANALDENFAPVPPAQVIAEIDELVASRYAGEGVVPASD
ncbi:alanine racemase [Sphaerisporangium sp. NPDC088356]|uniref:alanine racemase n=1 Tax=Sphaerisporangium sp. NPDC088356 TaxID=3154871 RepID=UPI00341C20CF